MVSLLLLALQMNYPYSRTLLKQYYNNYQSFCMWQDDDGRPDPNLLRSFVSVAVVDVRSNKPRTDGTPDVLFSSPFHGRGETGGKSLAIGRKGLKAKPGLSTSNKKVGLGAYLYSRVTNYRTLILFLYFSVTWHATVVLVAKQIMDE